MTFTRSLLTPAVLIIAFVGTSAESSAQNRAPAETLVANVEDEEVPGSSAPDEQALNLPGGIDLSGTWAQQVVQSTVSRVPIVGRVRASTETILLLELEQEGDYVTVTSEVCDIDVDSGGVVRTEIPEEFVDAIPSSLRGFLLRESGSGIEAVGWNSFELLGTRLDDPSQDALPTSPDDERVTDPDGDGNPGLTVLIRGMVDGEVYVVQRGWSTFLPETVSEEAIDGQVEWSNEQIVLDASQAVLRSGPPTEVDEDPDRNYFRTTRLEDGATCLDVLRDERRIFRR